MHLRSGGGKDLHRRRVLGQDHQADGKHDSEAANVEERLGHAARRGQHADGERRKQACNDSGHRRGESLHVLIRVGLKSVLEACHVFAVLAPLVFLVRDLERRLVIGHPTGEPVSILSLTRHHEVAVRPGRLALPEQKDAADERAGSFG